MRDAFEPSPQEGGLGRFEGLGPGEIELRVKA